MRKITWMLLVLLNATWIFGKNTMAENNHLKEETSPYLLQHADNPVHWFAWGPAALAKAKQENRLIFISIGYASCHWCHVMEQESFATQTTATILNAHFVAIKVDREERPDIDAHFMEILVAMTGSGGWPLNLILTPDLKPIYGGTYFPPESRNGLPSFNEILSDLAGQWEKNAAEMKAEADRLGHWLEKKKTNSPIASAGSSHHDPQNDPWTAAVRFWQERFDPRFGGLGIAPKFPHPTILSMLLRWSTHPNAENSALEHVRLTLDHMAAGGVRDQVGGSFHRYAVDRQWQIPHFEILLSDNALLARIYLEAFQRTGVVYYQQVAAAILDDMLDRFGTRDGCFISALDADTAGEEGRFYTWTEAELDQALGQERAVPFKKLFFDPMEGLVNKRSVLRFLGNPADAQAARQTHAEDLKTLAQERRQRPHPPKDDKIVTSWNGLMISALAKGGAIMKEPRYIAAAANAAKSLLTHSMVAGSLRHSRRDGRVTQEVFLEDYAFFIQGLLDLYTADFQLDHLETARHLAEEMLQRFQKHSGQPLTQTPTNPASPLPERFELEDGAIPAGNAAALVALSRLGWLAADKRWREEAKALRKSLLPELQRLGPTASELLWAWEWEDDRTREVVISGKRGDVQTQALLDVVTHRLIPGLIVVLVDPEEGAVPHGWPLLSARPLMDGKPTAYVCQNRLCRQPVTTTMALAKLLDEPMVEAKP
ncbi:MAG: thioredoxin domain-containing protein [Magnetococcus sp. THC-1_WYH]